MYVNQQGLAYALSAGTATITYTSPTGVKFSEWIMSRAGVPKPFAFGTSVIQRPLTKNQSLAERFVRIFLERL